MTVNKLSYPAKENATQQKINEIIDDYVDLSSNQNITGVKTFVGQKKIGFKQSGSSDKLGFTLYNNSGTEKGYLEFNPTNTIDNAPLMTLGNYASSAAAITHVGFRKYSSVSGASGAYNLLAPLISDAKTPFNLTTTYTNFYLPLGFSNGSTTVTTAKTGLVDISSLLPSLSGYATETWVEQQGYAVASSLATVATSGSYADLIDTPTIPAVNNATLTITQGGVSKGTFTANASSDVTIELDAGGGTATDVQINGTSITSSNVANIITNSAYNSSSNKIATMSDLPTVPTKISDLTDDTVTYPIDKADTLTNLTASITELNYVDGVTSSIQTQLDGKLSTKPDGTNNLIDSNNKVNISYMPDVVLGQMLYAGTFVPTTAVATLSTNAKTILGTTSDTITLTNDTSAITGYTANEGNYYIASGDGAFASISFLTGDWLVATADGWGKILNTDAVTGVKGNAESTYRTGNVNITADNVLPTQTSNSGKFLTTNGTTASWANIPAEIPSQSGNSGKFLTTNGSTVSWGSITGLPSQTSQSGKYLTTNGTSASWVSLSIPTTTDSITSGSSAALTSGGAYTNLVTAVAAHSTDANKINVTKAGSTSTITINDVAHATSADSATSATTASKLGSSTVGGTTTPIYLNGGTPTALSYTIAKSVPSNAIFTDTTYANGTGITIGTGNAINHSNSVTAGTAGTSSATSGSTLAVPYVTYDAQGHVTASGTHTHTVTGFSTTDTKTTACSYNSTSKLFLIGATAQSSATTDAQAKTTYSNSAVYEQNGYLYATTPASTTNDTTVATTKFVKDQGYTTNTGTVTSVNNVAPVNGNVSLTIPNYFAGGNISIDEVEAVTLPSGYTQVAYIEGTGAQYIDTGWKYSATYPIKIDCKFIVNSYSGGSGGYPTIYGLQTASYSNWIYPFYINAGNFNPHIGGSAGIDSVPCALGQVYDTSFTIGNGTWSRTINGTNTSGTWSGSITNTANMFLFGGSYGTNPINQLIGKIFSFKITVNNSVVRNYIPCKRNSDNVAGMYDLATSTFKPSASGNFLMGSDVTASGEMISATVPTKTSDLINDSNFITGITSSMVTTALGYTPYNSTNPSNYIANTATGTGGLSILGTAATAQYAVNIGTSASAGNSAVAVGYNTAANGARSVSIGYNARIGSSTADAIQIGYGTNSTALSFYVGFYNNSTTHYNWQMLDGATGLIPDARISSNIMKKSEVWYDSTSSTLYIGVAQS